MAACPAEALPILGTNGQRLYGEWGRETDERPVIRDCSIAEQSCEKSQGVIGQRGIHEGLLTFQGFGRAATRLAVSVEFTFDYLREEF